MELTDITKFIKHELMRILRTNLNVQQFILDLTRLQYADKWDTNEQFETLLAELKSIPEQQNRKWEINQQKLRILWQEQHHKWKETQHELGILREEHSSKLDKHQYAIQILLQEIKELRYKFESSVDSSWEVQAETIPLVSPKNEVARQATWGFVDYENFPQAVTKVNHDHLYIFVGPKQKNHGLISSEHVTIVSIEKQSQNNLDFHMAYCLGMFHQDISQQVEFVIYTKDTGLDNLIMFINQQGRKCKRVNNIGDNLPKEVSYMVEKLQDIQNKPKKQVALINSVTTMLQQMGTNLTAEKVVALLVQYKFIAIDSQNQITYHL